MEVKIDHELLRHKREGRAWTQTQLAEVAGLSMRTVQRIERNGVASKESAMALAGALDVALSDLLVKSCDMFPERKTNNRWYGIAGIIASLVVALGWWSTASAEQVLIDLSVNAEIGSSTHGDMHLLSKLGETSEIKFDRQFRVLMTASRQGKELLLSTKIYDYVKGEYHLIATPAILLADNELASIQVDTLSSGRLTLGFKSDF